MKSCYKRGGKTKAAKKSAIKYEKFKPGAKLKLKKGGKVEGKKSKSRLDKPSRSGDKSFKTGALLGARAGAKAGAKLGAQAASAETAMPPAPMPPEAAAPPMEPPMKRGGKVKQPTAGAGSGEGRIQKAKAVKKK